MILLIRFILDLGRYIREYGLFRGLLLYFKIKTNKTDKISFGNIKHSFRLRSNTSDTRTFDFIFTHREYDLDLDFFPKVIIDAGANIGLAAIFFATKYPSTKIISIEPEPSNYELLEENTRKYDNIIALNKALSNESDQDLAITDKGYGNWGFITEPIKVESKKESPIVKSISIKEIMKQYDLGTLDIVKIDIEGYEKEVFEKNSETWLPFTRCLIIELHDRMKNGCSKSFFSAICQHDLSFFHRGENLIFINNKLR